MFILLHHSCKIINEFHNNSVKLHHYKNAKNYLMWRRRQINHPLLLIWRKRKVIAVLELTATGHCSCKVKNNELNNSAKNTDSNETTSVRMRIKQIFSSLGA